MPPDLNNWIEEFFAEMAILALLGTGLFEKGLSLLQDRPYSGRRVFAYILMLYGLRQIAKLFY